MDWSVRKMSGLCGARLEGVALNDMTSAQFQTLRDALFAHGVVCLPNQSLDPHGHLALAKRFCC